MCQDETTVPWLALAHGTLLKSEQCCRRPVAIATFDDGVFMFVMRFIAALAALVLTIPASG